MDNEKRFITIWHKGMAVSIRSTFANLHKIPEGYRIKSDAEAAQIISAHAEWSIEILKLKMSIKQN